MNELLPFSSTSVRDGSSQEGWHHKKKEHDINLSLVVSFLNARNKPSFLQTLYFEIETQTGLELIM